MLSRGARAISTLRLRINRSFSNVSKSQRIADDNLQRAVFLGQRQNGVFAGDRFGHEFDDGGGNGDFVQIDEVQAMLLGHGPHDFFAGGVAEDDQLVREPSCPTTWRRFGFGQLVGGDDALADQDFGKVDFLGGHCESVGLEHGV